MNDSNQSFRWTDLYRVHIAELDLQHQSLFLIINELHDALEDGQGAVVMGDVLDRLMRYAGTHFQSEEFLMEKHGFPGLPTHRVEHEAFVRNMLRYVDDFRAGKVGAPTALLLFLQSWLKEHILKSDKAYGPYLRQHGVR